MDLEQVYREQYRSLVGFISKRIGDRARAEELAQEAFVRAIQQQPKHPRSWLYSVAANLVRDEARRAAVVRRKLRLVRQEVEVAPAADETWSRRERSERVRRVLDTLAPQDRQALLLKQEGLSYAEIAAKLGLSRGSIGTTLARARQRLAAAWQQASGEGGREDVAR